MACAEGFAAGVAGSRVPLGASPASRQAFLAGASASGKLDGSEHGEQVAVFKFLELLEPHWPELVGSIHAVPNGGQRSKAVAGKLKAEGVRSGIPDICVPLPSQGFSSLRLELKAKGGQLTDSQKLRMPMLRALGNQVAVCVGWHAAVREIIDYVWPEQ